MSDERTAEVQGAIANAELSAESVSAANPGPISQANDSRSVLEVEKLRLEIRELKHWWLRPHAVGAGATILITVVGFLSAVKIGYFDVARLEFVRTRLEADIGELQKRRHDQEEALRTAGLSTQQLSLQLEQQQMLTRNLESVLEAEREENRDGLSEYRAANQRLADRIRFLEEELARGGRAISDKSLSEASIRRELTRLQAEYQSSLEELSLLPPVVTGAGIGYDPSTTTMKARVKGINLGAAPGQVLFRVVRIKVSLTGKRVKPSREESPEVLKIELAREQVQEWTSRSIRFALSAGQRNTILDLRKQMLGRNAAERPQDISLGPDFDYEVRIRGASGLETDWQKIALWEVGTEIPN